MPSGVPEFDQFVEYVTADGIYPVALEQHSLLELPSLEAVRDGYAHVAQLGRTPALEVAQVTALKAAAGEVYHQDVVAHEIVHTDPATVVERLLWVRSRTEWHLGMTATAGMVAFFLGDGNLYTCIQGHTVDDPGWTPPATPALWKRYYEEAAPPWVQPAGAHDAYNTGDRVTFEGNIYESLIDANVWSPTAYPQGWQLIGPA